MDIEIRREKFLKCVRDITLLIGERRDILVSNCPFIFGKDARQPEEVKRIAQINKKIKDELRRLETIEKSGLPLLGAAAIIPTSTDEVRMALALLICTRLSARANSEFRLVGEIVEFIAGNNPSIAYRARKLFSAEGAVRPYIKVNYFGSENLDEWLVSLPDYVFARMLGEPATDEEKAFQSISLTKNNSRRR